MVPVVLVVLAALIVFAIAAGVIGRESRRLDAVAPRVIYVLDDAIAFVCDHVSSEAQARLTPGDVADLLRSHMARLYGKGLQPLDVTDRPQDLDVLILDEIDETAFVIGQATDSHLDVIDQDVAEVVAAHLGYLDRIGAVGPRSTQFD